MFSREQRFRWAVKIADRLHRPFETHGVGDPFQQASLRAFQAIRAIPDARMLEVGSRNVTGDVRRSSFPNLSEYVGLDILPGENVDIVGDAHRLADLVPRDHFDVVFSASVFEHLLFPWKVAMEINRVLKTGGLVVTATHPMWPEHEMPWDFWRFPRMGFHALFNVHTGFEIVDVAEGSPAKIYSLEGSKPTKRFPDFVVNAGVMCLARKVADYREDLLRWDIGTEFLGSMYPPSRSQSQTPPVPPAST